MDDVLNVLTRCQYIDTSSVRISGFESMWSKIFVFLPKFKILFCLDAIIFPVTKGLNLRSS